METMTGVSELRSRSQKKPELLEGCEVAWNGKSGLVLGVKRDGDNVKHRVRVGEKVLLLDLRKRKDLSITKIGANRSRPTATGVVSNATPKPATKKRKSFAKKAQPDANPPEKKKTVNKPKQVSEIDDIFGTLKTQIQERKEVSVNNIVGKCGITFLTSRIRSCL